MLRCALRTPHSCRWRSGLRRRSLPKSAGFTSSSTTIPHRWRRISCSAQWRIRARSRQGCGSMTTPIFMLLLSHPNNSGLQMDQVNRNYIPADFMQRLEVTYDGKSVFRLESDISISEDPTFYFGIRPADPATPGVVKAEIFDSSQRYFSQSWPVPAAAAQM